MDVEKAFDRVWHNRLIIKMHKLKSPQYLVKTIVSFLEDQSFRIKREGHLSTSKVIEAGIPQGSPYLYNIYTSDTPEPSQQKSYYLPTTRQ